MATRFSPFWTWRQESFSPKGCRPPTTLAQSVSSPTPAHHHPLTHPRWAGRRFQQKDGFSTLLGLPFGVSPDAPSSAVAAHALYHAIIIFIIVVPHLGHEIRQSIAEEIANGQRSQIP